MNAHPFIRLALLLLVIPAATAGPRFAITKSTIDGGGCQSESAPGTGEVRRFALTGTIGQPEAAPALVSASGRFSLTPGFWNDYQVVQTPDAPQLTIRQSPGNFVVLAWPVEAEGFVLEQSPDMTPGSWTLVLIPVVDTTTEHTVTVPITAPRMFFRLKHP